ncbi:MAG: tautomerase family protein [Candidatus Cloacimonetes bacterium]|nr:tautomerase family protein [Candidatus Cloacimonadota bacterium]
MEISLPTIELDKKQKLAQYLTNSFESATGISSEIFAIKFNEYKDNECFVGGKVVHNSQVKSRPYIHCLLYSPRLNKNVKSKLAKEFTDSFIKVFANIDWWPIIHICEHPYDNVAIEGQLLSDTYEHCKGAKFYYDLDDQ